MKIDNRVQFYLRHKAQIDEWLTLPELMHEEVHAFYKSLLPDIEGLATTLQGEVLVWSSTDRKRGDIPPIIMLYRPTWLTDDLRLSPLSVCLQWDKKAPIFHKAFLGVRANQAVGKEWADLYAAFALLRKAKPRAAEYQDDEGWWPAWRRVTGLDEGWWDEEDGLSRYAVSVVKDLERAWNLFAPMIDKAHGRLRGLAAFNGHGDDA